MRSVLTQLPPGPIAETGPVYWVIYLEGSPATDSDPAEQPLSSITQSSEYLVTGATGVGEVIAWAEAHAPGDGTLLWAEIEVAPAPEAPRCRIWHRCPDTPWSRREGRNFTW
ncbi:MAG: hypothetical protein LBM66_05315 [Bifidobacteriaceae bacterium]|jgi:hypothetical protein|nr:hypothetical protein [Bifidobacteriaceae bacterium]